MANIKFLDKFISDVSCFSFTDIDDEYFCLGLFSKVGGIDKYKIKKNCCYRLDINGDIETGEFNSNILVNGFINIAESFSSIEVKGVIKDSTSPIKNKKMKFSRFNPLKREKVIRIDGCIENIIVNVKGIDFSTFINGNCAVINSIKPLRCIGTIADAISDDVYCEA